MKCKKCHTEDMQLSKRELEIETLIVNGFHEKEIANKLYISTKTVNNHKTSIYRKRGVHNAIQLTRKILLREFGELVPSA